MEQDPVALWAIQAWVHEAKYLECDVRTWGMIMELRRLDAEWDEMEARAR